MNRSKDLATTLHLSAGAQYIKHKTATSIVPIKHRSTHVLRCNNTVKNSPVTRILCFSTLYPNSEQPNHGIFVENRLRHTLALGDLQATVLAPVPYFPFQSRKWGRYSAFARIPKLEQRQGVVVHHPRFPVVPKIGSLLTPLLLFLAARRSLRKLLSQGFAFDLIDAHYFYPDGVAAALLARAFNKPFVVTARGSDLTQHAKNPFERSQILWAARSATALVTVSQSLKTELGNLGIGADKIAVLRNGVETDLFRPLVREKLRSDFGITRHALLSVGALIPRKGHEIAIEALSHLPDCELLIAGSGPLREKLQNCATQFGVASRVRFLGQIAHRDLPNFYNAADAFVLMSSREGWANVILESLACGTPVIATDVGGSGEIIRSPVAGRLLSERSPQALAREIQSLRANPPERVATRKYAEAFGWGPVAATNHALFKALADTRTPISNVARQFSVAGPDSA